MIGKQYFLQIKPANHAERFRRLRNGLQRSVALACNLYQAPLRPQEDGEDRAVVTVHRLWDLALDNLLDAWDGDPAELVDYVRSTVEPVHGERAKRNERACRGRSDGRSGKWRPGDLVAESGKVS